jgi:RNA polymerase sigma-70 factor, ECF subfamily
LPAGFVIVLIVDTYSQFYSENKDRLYAYLLRMTGETQLAVDLVQESFVRYLGRYGSQDGGIRSLLFTIARNAALDAIRQRKSVNDEVDACEDPGNNPEQQVIHRQALERMLAAIGQLVPKDREMISLVATADLTYYEIASILNISEANVKVRVHRARTKLRAILG